MSGPGNDFVQHSGMDKGTYPFQNKGKRAALKVAYKSFMYVASFEVLYEVRLDDVYACRGDN